MKIQKKLVESIDKIINVIDKGAEFGAEQLPLFAQEILTYFAYRHTLWVVILGLCLGFCVIGLRYMAKEKADEGIYLVPVIFTILATCYFVSNVNSLIKIKLAPKLYLVEAIKELL